MKDNVTSWIVSICTPVALLFSVMSKVFVDPLRTVIYGGVLIILAGVTAIWGHILGEPVLFQWFGEQPGMAVETAAMLVVLGAEVITLAVAAIKLTQSIEGRRTRKRS